MDEGPRATRPIHRSVGIFSKGVGTGFSVKGWLSLALQTFVNEFFTSISRLRFFQSGSVF